MYWSQSLQSVAKGLSKLYYPYYQGLVYVSPKHYCVCCWNADSLQRPYGNPSVSFNLSEVLNMFFSLSHQPTSTFQ